MALNRLLIALALLLPSLSTALEPAHELRIERGQVWFDGRQIPLPASLDQVVQVLGPYTRGPKGSSTRYTWDELGIYVLENYHSKRVSTFTVFLEKKPQPWRPKSEEDRRPKMDFNGTLLVDGVNVTRETTLREFNKRTRGPKLYESYISTKWQYRVEEPVPMILNAAIKPDRRFWHFELFYEGEDLLQPKK